MAQWNTLFDGYDIYTDVYDAHPNLYEEATEHAQFFEVYRQMVRSFPEDFSQMMVIFSTSLFLWVILLALIFTFVMPILRKPRSWQ